MIYANTLAYDTENRLTGVTCTNCTPQPITATFTYDGDGNRVRATVGGVTSTYVGNYYEVTGATTRKYYYLWGKRVAEYDGATLNYLLGDHLGSTAITANSSGSRVAELRYKPWGETRYTYQTTPTTFRYQQF